MEQKIQFYKGIRLGLINRNYKGYAARRFTLGGTNQNVWIPCKHLEADGTIRSGVNIEYVFRKAQRQLELAGYNDPIPGIKSKSSDKKSRRKQNWTFENQAH